MEHGTMNMNSSQKDRPNLQIPMAIREEYGGAVSDFKDPRGGLD